MNVTGSYTFDAPAQQVWDLLLNTEAVAACVPGCESLEPISENKFRASLTMAISAVTGRYEGTVEMADLVPPSSYRLVVHGKGKPGIVNGGTNITLTEADGITTVAIDGTVQVAGTIARVGQRLLGGVSKMMMDRFFNCLKARLEHQRTGT